MGDLDIVVDVEIIIIDPYLPVSIPPSLDLITLNSDPVNVDFDPLAL